MSYPTLVKRLLAAFYDSFLVLATIFIATALTMPFTQGNVSAENKIFMSLYLLSVVYIFYGWFWTHGGQTLGMRAWQQQLVSKDGKPVNWQQAFIRFITALPAWLLLISGIFIWALPEKIELTAALSSIPRGSFAIAGLVWVWANHQPNSWCDKASGTEVITTS